MISKIRKSVKAVLVGAMVVVMLSQTGVTVKAEDSTASTGSMTEKFNELSSNGATTSVPVTVTRVNRYKVKMPASITMGGADGKGSYTVSVEAELGTKQYIDIVPDSSFDLSDGKGGVVTVSVTQSKIRFTKESIGVDGVEEASGDLTASELYTGSWSGNLTFTFNTGSIE